MKIGFIGGGRVVSWQLERLEKVNGLEFCGIYDIDPKVIDNYKKSGLKVFNNLTELISSKLDVIAICTPSDSHMKVFSQVAKLCDHDQIITIEKPTFLQLNDFKIANEIIKNKNLNVFPVFQNRYNNAVSYARDLIKNKKIGNLLHAKINLSWCRPQRYYDQAEWRGMWASDGGSLTNQGIHFIDLARYLCGEVNDVSFRMDRSEISIECENVAVGSLRTQEGKLISVDINTISRPDDHNAEVTLYGSKGLISLGGIAANKILESTNEFAQNINEDFPNAYGYGHEKFFLEIEKFLKTGDKSGILSSMKDAELTLNILHAAYTSASKSAEITSTIGPFNEILGYNPKPIAFK